ncbi:hypothetical protein JW964_19375 [candidate division KSB1 bacterium]|nr:hypothetical protein [candidate division KSB1 bacterium]
MNICGKVAHIIDETRVILNIGEKQGVKLDQIFLIYQEGDEVFDPDTNESLGKVELPKGRVVVEHVQEKMAIAATEKKIQDETSRNKILSELMVDASIPRDSEREKLPIDPYHLKPFPQVTSVKVGDLVRSIDSPAV